MSAPVFISYSSKDQKIAGTIAQALEARGQRCWIASRDVRAGDNFQEAIVRALRDAKLMLLVFSANANNSDEIKKELVLAGRHRVTVVPVRVEDVVPNDAFSYELATRQWVDLFQDWETQIEQLVAQVEMILAAPASTATGGTAAPIPPAQMWPPQKKKSPNAALMAGLAILAVLIAGALAWLQPWASKPPMPVTTAAATAPVAAPPAATQAAAPPAQSAPPQSTAMTAPAMKEPAAKGPAMMAMTGKRKSDAPAAAAEIAKAPQIVALAAPSSPTAPAAAAAGAAVVAAPGGPAQTADPDEAAWQSASRSGTRDAYDAYVRNFAGGVHFGEAQLALANMILAAPATGTAFDGTWQTVWTCANLGQYPGYSFRYEGTIRNGVYHGSRGEKGAPSSMVLDGRIDADGIGAFYGEVVVGSSLAGLGAARGTPSDFHALAHFDGGGGSGKRLEGRGCMLSFSKG